MDTPIAMILMLDWTTDFIESVADVVVVPRDMEDGFVKSDIKIKIRSNPIEFKRSYIMDSCFHGYSHAKVYTFFYY
jgi:hypothetical protein